MRPFAWHSRLFWGNYVPWRTPCQCISAASTSWHRLGQRRATSTFAVRGNRTRDVRSFSSKKVVSRTVQDLWKDRPWYCNIDDDGKNHWNSDYVIISRSIAACIIHSQNAYRSDLLLTSSYLLFSGFALPTVTSPSDRKHKIDWLDAGMVIGLAGLASTSTFPSIVAAPPYSWPIVRYPGVNSPHSYVSRMSGGSLTEIRRILGS